MKSPNLLILEFDCFPESEGSLAQSGGRFPVTNNTLPGGIPVKLRPVVVGCEAVEELIWGRSRQQLRHRRGRLSCYAGKKRLVAEKNRQSALESLNFLSNFINAELGLSYKETFHLVWKPLHFQGLFIT